MVVFFLYTWMSIDIFLNRNMMRHDEPFSWVKNLIVYVICQYVLVGFAAGIGWVKVFVCFCLMVVLWIVEWLMGFFVSSLKVWNFANASVDPALTFIIVSFPDISRPKWSKMLRPFPKLWQSGTQTPSFACGKSCSNTFLAKVAHRLRHPVSL